VLVGYSTQWNRTTRRNRWEWSGGWLLWAFRLLDKPGRTVDDNEAIARSLACLGRDDDARRNLALAKATPIADAEDRVIFDGDVAAEPWFGLM
jgi:hypothetical protein